MNTGALTLRTDDLAYYDSLHGGPIPCKVLSITGRSGLASTAQTVTLKVTADSWPYRKGAELETSGLHAFPRRALTVGDCGLFGINAYLVEAQ